MTVTVTDPATSIIAANSFQELSTSLSIIIIASAMLLLIVKELARQYAGQWKILAPALDAITAPTILATMYIISVRILDLANVI